MVVTNNVEVQIGHNVFWKYLGDENAVLALDFKTTAKEVLLIPGMQYIFGDHSLHIPLLSSFC
jgi:hypothetical protein